MVPKAETDSMEAGGILKLLFIFKFIAAACLTVWFAVHTPTTNEVSHMGITFRISFVSSTLVTVADRH